MNEKSKYNPDAVLLGDVLQKILKSNRSEANFDLTQIWNVWNDAVGPVISENAPPVAFKGNLLLVYVNSSAWVHQLRFLKQDMIMKLNRKLEQELVADITFKVGTW